MASSSVPPSARADGPGNHPPLIPPPSDTGMGAAVASLPDDPLVEIFSRLPARSLCRFKCVSKAWLALITDPVHRKRLRQALEGFFLMKPTICGGGSSIYSAGDSDCSYLGEGQISFVDLIAAVARPVPRDIDPFPSSLKELTAIQVLSFRDSCNGLLLFDYHPETDPFSILGYVVCNPTTKQWGGVPPCSCPSPTCYSPRQGLDTYTYLAFDPAASSHFHLVQCQSVGQFTSLHIYSSETGTWTHTQGDEQEDLGRLRVFVPRYRHSAAFVNGVLHVLASGQDGRQIIAVDIQRKTRKMVRAPDLDKERRSYIEYFGQSQGHLYCITGENFDVPQESYTPSYIPQQGYTLSFWVLQDYDAQEWVLKDTVTSLELSVKMRFLGDGCKGNSVTTVVVDIHQDCDMVFFTQSFYDKLLLAYDMGRKEVTTVATTEKHDWLMDCARYFPCFSESPALTNKL